MDDELEKLTSSDDTPKSVVEIFDDQCAYYISIGMTYTEYWDGDAMMPRFYRKAEELKQKRENYNAWLQGAYVYEAIKDLAPSINAFSKGHSKPYRDTVIPITPTEIREHEEKKKKERYDENLARFKGLVQQINEEMMKNQEVADGSGTGRPEL